jgi:hypothetical protein
MKFCDKIKKMLGYTYMVNLSSKEIHDLKNTHVNCNLELIVHKKFITKRMLKEYLQNGYNGCRWCMPEYNKE